MRRREFLAAVASASIWPHLAVAQSTGLPIVGFLSVRSAEDLIDDVAAFRLGLKEGATSRIKTSGLNIVGARGDTSGSKLKWMN